MTTDSPNTTEPDKNALRVPTDAKTTTYRGIGYLAFLQLQALFGEVVSERGPKSGIRSSVAIHRTQDNEKVYSNWEYP